MKTRLISSTAIIFLLSFLPANSQDAATRGRFTNSIYVLETADRDGGEPETRARLYQYLRFQARWKEMYDLRFNITARALTDLQQELDSDRRFNAYRLSLSAGGLFNNLLDLEIGRQFLHPGMPLGGIDGARFVIKPASGLYWDIFGGAEANLFNSFKIYELDESTILGSTVRYNRLYDTNIQLAYYQKTRDGEEQWQVGGLNFTNTSVNIMRVSGQFHYDFINSRLHRMYLSTRFRPGEKFYTNLMFKQQYPQVYGDSYFRIFELEQYSQAGLSSGYFFNEEYAVNGSYRYIMLEDGAGHILGAGISNNNGSFQVVYETGDLGNQIALQLDYVYAVTPELDISAAIDYTRYRFEKIYDYENQLANAVRLGYKFTEKFRTSLEYQWLNNRFFDSDQRLLNHIHYIW